MKTIYLVRHGEGEGNISTTWLPEDSPLTEKGVTQAQEVAERCARLAADALVSSTLGRARQTADLIGKRIGKNPEYSPLFVERTNPSVFQGQLNDAPDVLTAIQTMRENRGVPGYHFTDEENFDDLKARAAAALEWLAGHEAESIVVVTHGFFMRCLFLHVLFGQDMTVKEYMQVIGKISVTHTGISVFRHDPENDFAPWAVTTWNDSAHLG